VRSILWINLKRSKKMSFCYRTSCLCSIMGVKIKITSQKEKRIAFTIRSFF